MEYPKTIRRDIIINGRNYLNKLRNACTKCKGTGIKILTEDTCEQCDCAKQFYLDKKYVDANISSDYFNITFDDLKKNFTHDCYNNYVKLYNSIEKLLAKGYSLMILKNTDQAWGISTTGNLLIKKLVDLNKKCLIIDSLKLFDCFFSFGNENEINSERTKQFNFYVNFPILMIDGVGTEGYRKEQKQGFIFQKFCNFLKRRKSNGRATILCSDLKMDDINDVYDKVLVKYFELDMLKFKINTITSKTTINFKIHKDLIDLNGVFDDPKPREVVKSEMKIIPRR